MRAAAFCAALLCVTTLVGAVPQYQLQPLGTLGGLYLEPASINNAGEIAGWGTIAGGGRHAFYIPAGGTTPQQITTGPDGFAAEINDAGVIAGEHSGRAFRWEAGVYSDLGPGFGTGINDAGDIVGYDNGIAFRWRNGNRESLGVPDGTLFSHARDINNNGVVLANITLQNNTRSLGTWLSGAWTVWNHLATGEVDALNDLGQATGYYNNHAFLWQNGALQDLGTLHGLQYSRGHDVSNVGEVVGTTYNITAPGGSAAFIWESGVMHDLEDVLDDSGAGYQLITAWSINEVGQIVATGVDPSGSQRAVLLTPIPEPSTLALVSVGALALRQRRTPRPTRHARV